MTFPDTKKVLPTDAIEACIGFNERDNYEGPPLDWVIEAREQLQALKDQLAEYADCMDNLDWVG